MGVFFFHGCGSGKSECASQVIESNKLLLDEHSTTAIFLVPNEMIMSSVVYDLLGKEVLPNGNIRFRKKGTGDCYIDEKLRNYLNEINSHQHTNDCDVNCEKNQQSKIRKVVNYIKKEKILRYYEIETHQRFAKYIEKLNDYEVSSICSNRVIIVDEIHKIRNQTSLYKSLLKIAMHAYNVKFVFMSGTACVDRETEIIPIINLLRLNDGKSNLLTDQDIRFLFHKLEHKKKAAEQIFAEKVKGYISFIRGMNPITFPIRREAGERFTRNINFNTVECVMKGTQLINYLNCFFNEFNPNIEANVSNELWEKTRSASRCAFENTTREQWLYQNVGDISSKFEKMWENFQLSNGKGAILIYAFNIEKGINLVERFLQANGIEMFTLENASQKTPKYFNFSNVSSTEVKQRALDICKSHENYKGEYIKFILGTGKIRTGITFKHLSQVHVFEPDWNLPTTEQTVFRGARQFSHHHPEIPFSNREIITFRYRSVISTKQLEQLPIRMKGRYDKFIERNSTALKNRGFLSQVASHTNNNNNTTTHEAPKKRARIESRVEEKLISIDDYMYKTCLRKDIPGNRVERLAKIYATDNPLQIRANFFPHIEDESFEGSRYIIILRLFIL